MVSSLILLFAILTVYSGFYKLLPATIIFAFFIIYSLYNLSYNKQAIVSIYAVLYILCIFYFLFGLFFSQSMSYGANKLLFFLLFSLCGICILFSDIDKHFEKYMLFFSVPLLLIMYLSFGTPFEVLSKLTNIYYRMGEEVNSNPIVVSRGLGLSLIFLLTSFFTFKKNVVISCLVIILIIPTFIYMLSTGSKGPLIALVLSLIINFLFFSSRGAKKYFPLLVLFASVFFTVNEVSNDDGFLKQRFSNEGSVTSRTVQYYFVIESSINGSIPSLVFGNGLGSYSHLKLKSDTREYPHNLMLELLYEAGVVGVGLITVLFLYPLFLKFKLKTGVDTFSLCLVYFIINAQFSGDLLSNLFWVIFACLLVSKESRNIQPIYTK
jgi:hypothetical protein